MESMTATDYVWFVMLGLIIGWIFEIIFKDQGIGMAGNLITGVISSIFGGLVFAASGLISELLYALYTSMVTLIVFDVFHIAIWYEKHPSKDSTTRIIHKLH